MKKMKGKKPDVIEFDNKLVFKKTEDLITVTLLQATF